jgi:hypothetical protein
LPVVWASATAPEIANPTATIDKFLNFM